MQPEMERLADTDKDTDTDPGTGSDTGTDKVVSGTDRRHIGLVPEQVWGLVAPAGR